MPNSQSLSDLVQNTVKESSAALAAASTTTQLGQHATVSTPPRSAAPLQPISVSSTEAPMSASPPPQQLSLM
eukprot:5049651-Lingulodinium_polyedra.AAC.1